MLDVPLWKRRIQHTRKMLLLVNIYAQLVPKCTPKLIIDPVQVLEPF